MTISGRVFEQEVSGIRTSLVVYDRPEFFGWGVFDLPDTLRRPLQTFTAEVLGLVFGYSFERKNLAAGGERCIEISVPLLDDREPKVPDPLTVQIGVVVNHQPTIAVRFSIADLLTHTFGDSNCEHDKTRAAVVALRQLAEQLEQARGLRPR